VDLILAAPITGESESVAMDYSNVPQSGQQQQYYQPVYGGMTYGTGAFAPPKPRYGGFWARVLAYILDGILLLIVQLILMALITNQGALTLANLVIGWLYFAGLESNMGATPGKLVMGMRITTVDGQNISFLRATGRYFAKILSALILMIGYLMVAWDGHKQGLHDKIAGTYVIKP
jgi:uncharacterized RDD family membrane protein YckC